MTTLTTHIPGLDDLSVRFIINLPKEELETPSRIGFQIEEAHWYYEDFIRPLDPTLPSLNLRNFCSLIFQHCPLLSDYSGLSAAAYEEFLAYKTRVPVRGAILLDPTMNNVVLVKGWKKGAKWSFPRGKINKDEKDLDCAVREVYEETGFDVKAAGLVPEDEESVKYIDVSLREQQMRLYVFRGVSTDTHFEPKTRKEISKIQWYRLSDLPTLKKEKQLQEEGGNGNDLKGSLFYMVAPFLGPLRKWIGQQRRTDKAKLRAAHPRGLIIEDDDTELEANGQDNAASDIPPDYPVEAQGEADHMARLLAGLHSSKQASTQSLNLPEVSDANTQSSNPALELKRLLSVGNPSDPQIQHPVPQREESNPLLALLRGSSTSHSTQDKMAAVPQVLNENFVANPSNTTNPHHTPLTGMQPSQFSKLQTPPRWTILLRQTYAFHSLYSPSSDIPPDHASYSDMRMPPLPPPDVSPGFVETGPTMQPSPGLWPTTYPHPHPLAMIRPPMQQPSLQQANLQSPPQPPKPVPRHGDPFAFAPPLPQFPGLHSPAIPQATSLPPPKLTSHSLALLNALKSPHEQPLKKAPYEQRALVPSILLPVKKKQVKSPDEVTPPSGLPSADSPTQERQELPTASPPATTAKAQPPTVQVNNAQPRTAHQDTLLNLFRSNTATQQAPTNKASGHLAPIEPVELSAHHSPHASRSSFFAPPKPLQHQLPALSTNVPRHGSPGLTSATVSGPLNAPDFETVRRAQKNNPSSATGMVPPMGGLVPVEMGSQVQSTIDITAPQPRSFQPQILKRPPQSFSGPSSGTGTPQPQSTDAIPASVQGEGVRVAQGEAERKASLLSLFTSPGSKADKAITPVSPLPDFSAGMQSAAASARPSIAGIVGVDDELASRSRISSITSVAANTDAKSRQGSQAMGSATGVVSVLEQTPVSSPLAQSNADFFLGFLQGVAKSAEGMKRP